MTWRHVSTISPGSSMRAAVDIRTRAATRAGARSTRSSATRPPIDVATSTAEGRLQSVEEREGDVGVRCHRGQRFGARGPAVTRPVERRPGCDARRSGGSGGCQMAPVEPPPCRKTSGLPRDRSGAIPGRVEGGACSTFTAWPAISKYLLGMGKSNCIPPERSNSTTRCGCSATGAPLVGVERGERERVDAVLHEIAERRVDRAVPLEARAAAEPVGHDDAGVVPAGRGSGVSDVLARCRRRPRGATARSARAGALRSLRPWSSIELRQRILAEVALVDDRAALAEHQEALDRIREERGSSE